MKGRRFRHPARLLHTRFPKKLFALVIGRRGLKHYMAGTDIEELVYREGEPKQTIGEYRLVRKWSAVIKAEIREKPTKR